MPRYGVCIIVPNTDGGYLMLCFRRFFCLALFLGLWAMPQPILGQVTGTIYGTVLDASGATVPGAQVTARNSGTNAARTVASDDEGRFVIPLLPVGEYSLSVERTGFNAFEQKSVLLQAN